MPTSIELYAILNQYLAGRITSAQLEEWLAPRLHTIMSTPDADVAYVAGTAELCLAEIAGGARSERSAKTFLRKHLADRLRVQMIYAEYAPSSAHTVSGASAVQVITPPPVFGSTSPSWLTDVRIEPQAVPA